MQRWSLPRGARPQTMMEPAHDNMEPAHENMEPAHSGPPTRRWSPPQGARPCESGACPEGPAHKQ